MSEKNPMLWSSHKDEFHSIFHPLLWTPLGDDEKKRCWGPAIGQAGSEYNVHTLTSSTRQDTSHFLRGVVAVIESGNKEW